MNERILQPEPEIVCETTGNLWQNNLLQLISTKGPTESCLEAAKKRITFDTIPTPPIELDGEKGFDAWMDKHYVGVPIDCEIKTGLFACRNKANEPLFLAVHLPADREIASNGVLKSEVRDKLGIEIVGDLDKARALSKLNENLSPLLEDFRNIDRARLAELERLIQEKGGNLEAYKNAVQDHAEDPNIKFGMLNPWTLLMAEAYSHDTHWQEKGVKDTRIIHLVDANLASRKEVSTTNAGSQYFSMTIHDTAKAFGFLQFALAQAAPEGKALYAVSGTLQKERQIP